MVVNDVFDTGEIAADQREQIGRLGKRIVPDGEMPRRAGHLAAVDEIAVGEKNRGFALIGFDPRRINRHHIRPVEEISDAPKAFGLALRAIGRAGAVQPHELRIAGRIDDGLDGEFERPVRHLRDGQPIRRGDEILRCQRLAVERKRAELQVFAVEDERRRSSSGVGPDLELGADRRRGRMQRYVKVDGFDEPIRRAIILQADGAGFFGAHGGQ